MSDTIDRSAMSVRARKAMARLSIVTWNQLEALDFDTLLSVKNAGPTTVKEVLVALSKKLSGNAACDNTTLRDEFALRSMPVIAQRMDSVDRNWTPEMLADTAYEIADAMIAARDKTSTKEQV